jgi:hypothetical protein
VLIAMMVVGEGGSRTAGAENLALHPVVNERITLLRNVARRR